MSRGNSPCIHRPPVNLHYIYESVQNMLTTIKHFKFYNIPSLENNAALDILTSLDFSFSTLTPVPSKKFRRTTRISEDFEYTDTERRMTKVKVKPH